MVREHAEKDHQEAILSFPKKYFKDFNGDMQPDSHAAGFIVIYFNYFHSMLFSKYVQDEQTRRVLLDQWPSLNFVHNLIRKVAEENDTKYMAGICEFTQKQENGFNGVISTRNCREAVLLAMLETLRAMANTAGPDNSNWRYRTFARTLHRSDPFANIPLIGKFFQRESDSGGS